ncbi:hypothetical protein [Pyrobaculum arsenaticum]|uniref:PaREP7 n=1 Tax=Pyrobaculum arsenaticum (strain DSM 13514 / JCM 11321 / PZ6) TaxID=340102 RepID=A4WMG6_PYRAR|nr:hypothetical protein [Pyrobaculum arsenaticum]ABP51583.1 hypothetical protein Pars_2036 [Pyrobaculum arsenaticum DSM 13514]
MSLSAEEKRRFLKALEEDQEFRYAVAGLLGLGEVLNELRRLREDFNKYVEKSERRWRQNERRWKENEKRWKEWFDTWKKFLEDYEKRWQENERRWEEERKRWEAWYEAWKEFLEDYKRRWEDANRRFSRIEETLGAVAESQYTRYVWEDLKEEIKARGELVIRRVRNAKVDNVDVDLLVETDRRVYVVEVKIRPRVEDVGALLAKAEVVRGALSKEVVPVLTGTWIGDDVEKYARGKGVLIYSY